MRSNKYQLALIASGIIVSAFFAVFLWRELFPEYKIYQKAYVALEEFRSSYTHQPPPNFQYGVKQILIEKPDKGPPDIDRCVSCHVALEFAHFSPTKIARDINGNIIYNDDGTPLQIPNDEYVWGRLDQKIAELLDPSANEALAAKGESGKVNARLKEAEYLRSLKTADAGEHTYDMTKVLRMHPLIGRETRPFEFHPINQYGCVSCHNGNGRALTTDKAHGPVFDGMYEAEKGGHKPVFLEVDKENDPKFASVFNHKPGHDLIFQTTPLYVGGLIEAKCVQCHQPSSAALNNINLEAGSLFKRRENLNTALITSLENDKLAAVTALTLLNAVKNRGLEKTLKELEESSQDYALSPQIREIRASQFIALKDVAKENPGDPAQAVKTYLSKELVRLLGSEQLITDLSDSAAKKQDLDQFIKDYAGNPQATGSLFKRWETVQFADQLAVHASLAQMSLQETVKDINSVDALSSDVDNLLKIYKKGYSLYTTQACYACHRIAGIARGGVGPELTYEGNAYPWFIKESLVWPQADVKTSTMPNYRLDHEELEALVAFLLAQNGQNQAISDTAYKIAIKEWEAGRKTELEKPVPQDKIQDVRYGMTIFATEGCAACHRLTGFESDVGFKVEKDKKANFNAIYSEKQWFQSIIPETISSRELVQALNDKAAELDSRLADGVRQNSILEEIESKYPGLIMALYPAFKFASRAKNSEWGQGGKEDQAKLAAWKERLRRVLMVYVQEYGLGRLIGPRPNWSGVYRSDTWLMEHFRNPSAYSPKSIMPAFPFDDTKFYALTYMLDVLGRKNRDAVQAVWSAKGFNPQEAYEIHCAQCHGTHRSGNGPIAEWIYPVPKNLRNPDFMRNLTPERVKESLHFGVIGTPMPPWGIAAQDKLGYDGIPVLNEEQISLLTDWLFNQIPGGTVIKSESDTPKWEYRPEDVIKELKREGGDIKHKKGKNPLGCKPPLNPKYLFASLKPVGAMPQNDDSDITEYFDVVPNEEGKADKYSYYIKKEYYTPENLAEGKAFFEVNCAACHGREADGSGDRAEAMYDAKPRMLINLNWLKTRDDLRLLRSIKYGVPGTSMTPWGDLTTSKKRMQLVMFIRSLSEQAERREEVLSILYQSYDKAVQTVDLASKDSAESLGIAQKNYQQALLKRREADLAIAEGKESPDKAFQLYKEELAALKVLRQQESRKSKFDEIRRNILKEKELMQALGNNILNMPTLQSVLPTFIQAVKETSDSYALQDGKLAIAANKDGKTQINSLIAQIDDVIQQLDVKIDLLKGKILTPELRQQEKELQSQKQGLLKIKNRIISTFEETARLEQTQQKVYKTLYSNKESL